eukprot:NODE_4061_length_1121_cov_102.071142_g3867_i0.p1 GENE.NODE_4061_length_1121_cov_102.071142_g3867_i0~~NODE_4061_length_1121_cov_102.071142_g3867_i0.p1  ORF type:complete len:147 (+),score=23.94 NODE_4061_length_1121_cov_102.071142_g3867_i0:631-1071(+)
MYGWTSPEVTSIQKISGEVTVDKLVDIGDSHVAQGRTLEAITWYTQELDTSLTEEALADQEQARPLVDLYCKRSNAFLRCGLHDFALRDAERSVVANPTSGCAQLCCALAKQALGDIDGAKVAVDLALQLDPDSADIKQLHAVLYA